MSHRYLLLLLLVACWPVQAQVYKCVAENGDLTFSQTPCPDKNSKVTVERTATTANSDEADCRLAHDFALATAREMKNGVASNTVFDQYGGLGALSRGSVSLISYVYQYRTNDDVSAERVAALSLAKCRADSFGEVGCEQLPVAFTNQIGSCEMDEETMDAMMEKSGEVTSPPMAKVAAPAQTRPGVSPEDRVRTHAERREAKEREEQLRTECRQRIREKIDAIDAEMRSGYSASRGVALQNSRRDLKQQLHEC